jgi:predicted ATPase
VIESIRIESLRGIRRGGVAGIAPLSVLVGPNGSGKSTVLDALLLAASGSPGDAVGRVVKRRVELWGGGRWLFWRGGRTDAPTAEIVLESAGSPPRALSLELSADVSPALEEKLVAKRAAGPYTQVASTLTCGGAELRALTAIAYSGNEYVFTQEGSKELRALPGARLVDPRPGGMHALLWKSFADAAEGGRLAEVEALVGSVIPDLDRLLIVPDDAGRSVVHLGFADHTVPVAVAGDGIQTLVQVCLAVAQPPGTTVVLEEPESTQHPRSVLRSARAIAAAVKRGVQVILSTHSLELIDALSAEMSDELSKLAVHHLACPAGELSELRYAGAEVVLARQSIGEDLR